MSAFVLAATLLGWTSSWGAAQESSAEGPLHSWGLEEVRFGAYKQNIEGSGQEGGVAVNAELVFSSIFPRYQNAIAWALLSSSRPHLGASINTAGHTSQVYFGSTWTWPVSGPLFVEAAFGGALHDGPLRPHYEQDPQFIATYGCSVNFHESLSGGVNLGSRWRFMLTAEHMSNAGLCAFNRGLTNVGARMSLRFD